MEMVKTEGKLKRSNKSNRKTRMIIAALACLILAGTSSIYIYAKYYKTGYNKGMAIASGFYFSSDYMTELELDSETTKKINSIEDLMAEPAVIDQLYVKASDKTWDNDSSGGAQSSLFINIDNFSNQLLYNDKDLNVSYTIEFILLDSPVNVSYQVRKVSGTESYKNFTNTAKAVFTGELKGGELSWDEYQLQVSISNLSQYTTARILALAYPTSPSYVQNTKKLAGIITADYQESEIDITDQGFTIENELSGSGDWKEKVKQESALVYQLRTTGNYFGDGESGQRQRIKITWASDMYELNKYDKYRMELEKEYAGRPDELIKYFDETNGFMIVEILPYSSIQFVFYKKEGCDDKLGNTLEDFKKTIYVEKIDD